MQRLLCISCFILLFLTTIFFVAPLHAQDLLHKKISVSIRQQPLQQALSEIGREGNFYFSYNSSLLPEDSIVSINAQQKPVIDILHSLLGYNFAFHKNGHYIIIKKIFAGGRPIVISGYVTDRPTGEKIPNASVYVQRQFATVLTNREGYFQLKIKNRFPDIQIGFSKMDYKDTLLHLTPENHENLFISLSHIRVVTLPTVNVSATSKIENMWLSRWLLSSKQKIRDINLSNFFVKQPFQYSIWPGLGTHGKMNAQVVNKFSLNILGGYSSGTNGFELGGLFNMDKNDARYFQTAGLFNIVGGKMKGFQLAGLYNNVSDSSNGVQIGGLLNQTKNVEGIQIAGVANINRGTAKGLQLGGILNLTHKLKGLQIGFINISDSSDGYSIGAVNIVKNNPYYKLSFSRNETGIANAIFKSGNKKFYNMLIAGFGFQNHTAFFSFGYGFGKEFSISRKVSFTTEVTEHNFVVGYKEDVPIMVRIQPAFHFYLNKKISLFAGPAYSLYLPGSSIPKNGIADPLLPVHYFNFSSKLKNWFGFQAGISIF